jgi:hypothetical protein
MNEPAIEAEFAIKGAMTIKTEAELKLSRLYERYESVGKDGKGVNHRGGRGSWGSIRRREEGDRREGVTRGSWGGFHRKMGQGNLFISQSSCGLWQRWVRMMEAAIHLANGEE